MTSREEDGYGVLEMVGSDDDLLRTVVPAVHGADLSGIRQQSKRGVNEAMAPASTVALNHSPAPPNGYDHLGGDDRATGASAIAVRQCRGETGRRHPPVRS